MRYVFGLILLCVFSVPPAMARMYKWVDNKGEVHYGDTIPPQFSSQAASELNQRGIVVKKPGVALTPEQIKAREAARKQAKAQARRDRALLATYVSTQEIDQARNRRLRQIQQQINSLAAGRAAMQKRLTGNQQRAAALKKMNKPVPAHLAQQIKDAAATLKQAQDNIARKTQAMEKTRARFEADKLRFRKLTTGQ